MPVTGAGLEGIVATESRLCFIDGDAGLLSYQGFRIETLAEHATFEEVIYLLWHGRLPKQSELDALKAALVANRPIPAEVEAFLKSEPKASPMHVLRTAVSMLALSDPDANNVQAGTRRAEGREADGADGDHRHQLRPVAQGSAGGGGRSETGLRRELSVHAHREKAR